MKRVLLLLGVVFSLMFISCQEISDARKVAEDFYKYRQDKDYDKVFTTLNESIYDYVTEEDILSDLKAIDEEMGAMNSFSSNNFNIETKNGKTIASFSYKVVYDKGVMIDTLSLLKGSDGYKIIYYSWKKQ